MDATASTGYKAERAALGEALGTLAEKIEIRRIRRPDIESVPLLTDWWVLIVPAEGDIALEEDGPVLQTIAERLVTHIHDQFAFRTFIVFVAAGRVLPLQAVKLGATQVWPADEDDLAVIASDLGTEIMKSNHLRTWDSFVAALSNTSRAATLFRLRKQAALLADNEVFNDRFTLATKVATECHPSLQDEAKRLLERVEREPRSSQRTLAGEVYRSVTHGDLSDDLVALTVLRIHAMSIDLQESV